MVTACGVRAMGQTMSISGIGSGTGSYVTGVSSASTQLRTSFTQLQNAVAGGNLTLAQQAYTSFVQAYQSISGNPSGSSGSAVLQDLATLGKALQSEDLDSVKTALGTLMQDFQSLSQGNGAANPQSGSSSGTALTPTELTSAILSIFASGGADPAVGGADPLLAALSGGNANLSGNSDALLAALDGRTSGSGTTDPLLSALNGASATGSGNTDPLLQTSTSNGVNLLV